MRSRWLQILGTLWLIGTCACAHHRHHLRQHAALPHWPALDAAFLEQLAATQGFRLGRPSVLGATPDGTVLFRRTAAREPRADLYSMDASGQLKVIASVDSLLGGSAEQLSSEERARRERTRTSTSGIVDLEASRDSARLLIPLGERVFLLERQSGQARQLALGEGYAFDPHISPDGSRVAFVHAGDLWVSDVSTGALQRLTQHAADEEYGAAEFVAQEEFGRQRGYFWSPDSQALLFQRTRNAGVDTLYVSDARHPEREPTPFKYPRAGRPNAAVDFGIVSVQGGEPRWLQWDHARWPYVAHAQWSQHGPISLIVCNRAQTELALLAADAASAATRLLVLETDPAWVNVLGGMVQWLAGDAGFLWLHEAAQGYELELRAPSGERVRTLLAAGFGLSGVVGVTEQPRAVIVLASDNPREQHVWRVPLDGSAPVALTAGGGVHGATVSHNVVVISSSFRQGGSGSWALFADGRRQALPSLAEQPQLQATTRLETVSAEGRSFEVAITRPRQFDPKRSYPTLLYVYAGPGFRTVMDSLDHYRLDQWYADAGFIVVRADGRGTPGRGRDWERAISGDLISVPLTDQVLALEAVARRHREIDLKRVGVFGWSFGGYMSAMAVLLRPDVFKAAVAGAPVTDWSLYDTAYTERYMRTPAENPEGYARSSALNYAEKLSRPLLLMHGVTDDNVHFVHTLALIEALFRGGKRAEVVVLPGTHMLADPKLNFARQQVQVEFFREHL